MAKITLPERDQPSRRLDKAAENDLESHVGGVSIGSGCDISCAGGIGHVGRPD